MIKKITKQDYNKINQLLVSINYNLSTEDPFLKGYIYTKNEEIIGFICYSKIYDRVELNYIYVKEEYRNHKIASTLMEKMLTENVDNFTLEVDETNLPALKLYEKYQFQKVSKRENYYGTNSAIMMIRK